MVGIFSDKSHVLPQPFDDTWLSHADSVELSQMVYDFPLADPFEIQIEGCGDGFRVMLHSLETYVTTEPVPARLAGVPLHISTLVAANAILDKRFRTTLLADRESI